jgi:hypothetical protein
MTGINFHLRQKRIRLSRAKSEAGRPRQNDGLGVWREYQIAVAAKLTRTFDGCVTKRTKNKISTSIPGKDIFSLAFIERGLNI